VALEAEIGKWGDSTRLKGMITFPEGKVKGTGTGERGRVLSDEERSIPLGVSRKKHME